MTKTNFLRATILVLAAGGLSACEITNPRLNTGLSVGADGVSMQPSVQAEVDGGLLQYTPKLK